MRKSKVGQVTIPTVCKGQEVGQAETHPRPEEAVVDLPEGVVVAWGCEEAWVWMGLWVALWVL